MLKISVIGDCSQSNRYITFLTPARGFYLEEHVFSNHSVEINLDCQDQCALARECVSYNIGPMINNKMACELSNSDHLQHPEDLKPRKDWFYRATKVSLPGNICELKFLKRNDDDRYKYKEDTIDGGVIYIMNTYNWSIFNRRRN